MTMTMTTSFVRRIEERTKRIGNMLLVTVLLVLVSGNYAFLPAQTPRIHPRVAATTSQLEVFRGLSRILETSTTEPANGVEKYNGHQQVNGYANGSSNKIPFLIERLGDRPRDDVFKGIAEMCISVFFNNGKEGRAMPPWKEVQLSYLRMIQMADLRRRRARDRNTNAMFVAYRVEEAAPDAAQSKPLILNLRDVNNLNALSSPETKDYVRGEVLGFCEVSMVPFGLATTTSNVPIGTTNNGYLYDDAPPQLVRGNEIPRPVLTNLSVKKEARSSGVGSKLIAACERTASVEWGKSEIVLEVEDDNVHARTWYQKRGYRVLFSDPSSRRYDVNGLFLKKVNCTRQILRKSLSFGGTSMMPSKPASATVGGLNGMFRRLLQSSN